MDPRRKSASLTTFRTPSGYLSGSRIYDVYSHPYKVIANTTATTYITDPSMEGYGDDYFNGWTLVFIVGDSGTNKVSGERYTVSDYDSKSGKFTFTAGTNAPDQGDEYMLIPPVSLTHPYGFGGSIIWSVCTVAAAAPTLGYYDAQFEKFANDFFNNSWYLVPYLCTNATTAQLITDFIKTDATGEGKVVVGVTVGGNIVAGDVFMIVPKYLYEGGIGAIGSYGYLTKSIVSSSIPNNSQAAGGLIATATGKVLITDIVVRTDATGWATPTNIEFSTNNVVASGAGVPIVLALIAKFGASLNFSARGGATTHFLPAVLETTKTLYVHGDNAAGTGAGIGIVEVIYQRLTAGAILS